MVAGALAPSARAEVSVFTPMVGNYFAYFNRPYLNPSSGLVVPDNTIYNKLLAYVNGATPGSEIRGHITYLEPIYGDKKDIVDALIKANRRGVAVYLVQFGKELNDQRVEDPEDEEKTEGERLEDYFGTRHKWCYEDGGPVGPDDEDVNRACVSSRPRATHHIKNWMFSETVVDDTTIRHSSWVTSYNLTPASNRQFEDVFIVNDNQELYEANVESFKHFYGQRRTDDFYNVPGAGHHYIHSARTEISYSPHRRRPGSRVEEYSPATDHVAMALSRIDLYEPDCTLRVAAHSISPQRQYILDQLVRIRDLGCRVQVAYGKSYDLAAVYLINRGIEVHYAADPMLHSKMMVYAGRYDGKPGRKMVWGGSHNWNEVCLLRNDEVFVAISHPEIFRRYNDYFNVIWSRTNPPF
jgi:phosphatidylserine/phosphatidylglycerophosphate/cardiolipin synthase-like enzyme